MLVEDPNPIPATVSVGSIPPTNGAAFAYNGKDYLILAGGQHVCLDDNALVTVPPTTQVYQRTVAKVLFAVI